MLSQSQKKYINSLRLKKYRKRHGSYLVEGDKICKEIVLSQPHRIKSIYCTTDWHETHKGSLKSLTDIIINITLTELKQISNLKSPPPIILEVLRPADVFADALTFDSPTFYLDRIQDPGNLGTIIRICDWFGMKQLVISEGCTDPLGAKVIQSSMASHTRIQIVRSDLQDIKRIYPFVTVWAADMGGQEINQLPSVQNQTLIIIGNEGQGLDPVLLPLVDKTVGINGHHSLGAESLNAGISVGILAHHFRACQRRNGLPS